MRSTDPLAFLGAVLNKVIIMIIHKDKYKGDTYFEDICGDGMGVSVPIPKDFHREEG